MRLAAVLTLVMLLAACASMPNETPPPQPPARLFNDALFAAQDSIGTTGWDAFAQRAGVPDLPAFARCMSAPTADAALARDTLAARKLEVTGTPTYLVNDRRFVGAPPLDSLRAQVERARRSAAVSR